MLRLHLRLQGRRGGVGRHEKPVLTSDVTLNLRCGVSGWIARSGSSKWHLLSPTCCDLGCVEFVARTNASRRGVTDSGPGSCARRWHIAWLPMCLTSPEPLRSPFSWLSNRRGRTRSFFGIQRSETPSACGSAFSAHHSVHQWGRRHCL